MIRAKGSDSPQLVVESLSLSLSAVEVSLAALRSFHIGKTHTLFRDKYKQRAPGVSYNCLKKLLHKFSMNDS